MRGSNFCCLDSVYSCQNLFSLCVLQAPFTCNIQNVNCTQSSLNLAQSIFLKYFNVCVIYCNENSQDFSVIKHIDFSRKDCSLPSYIYVEMKDFYNLRLVHKYWYFLFEIINEIINWSFSIEVHPNNILNPSLQSCERVHSSRISILSFLCTTNSSLWNWKPCKIGKKNFFNWQHLA